MAALQYPRGRYRGILVSVVDPHLLMQNRHCEQPLHFAWCVLCMKANIPCSVIKVPL